jgi:hypothetical protein
LAPLTNLRKLNLEGVKVTDTALKRIKQFRRLNELNLCGTDITDASLKELATLTELRKLHLRGTKATETGVAKLREKLRDCDVDWGPPVMELERRPGKVRGIPGKEK